MKTNKQVIFFLTSILLFTVFLSCEIDNTQENYKNNSYSDSRIAEEKITMIKPVEQYNNYFTTENMNIYGLTPDGYDKIEIIDQDGDIVKVSDFFVKSGDLYFTVKEVDNTDPENVIESEVYYKQTGDSIEEISSLPVKPSKSRIQYNSSEFSIENFNYEGTPCSDVKNLSMQSGIERFLMVDGLFHFEGLGLLFNVTEGRGNIRVPGLYMWPLNRTSINKVLSKGILW